jgi:GntR family transcriptional regulator
MIVTVDPDSPVPPFEQLRVQISGLIAGRGLPVGARLPSVRQLAKDLGLAPGTVARAYRELEDAGFVETRGRHGTIVLGAQIKPSADELRSRLRSVAAAYVSSARSIGASDVQIRDELNRHLQAT